MSSRNLEENMLPIAYETVLAVQYTSGLTRQVLARPRIHLLLSYRMMKSLIGDLMIGRLLAR